MKLRTILFLSVATLLLAATVMTIPAHSAPAVQTSDGNVPVTSPVLTTEQVSAAYAYWTPEKMAAAIPMEKTVTGEPGANVNPALAVPQGEAGFAEGNAPGQPSKPAVNGQSGLIQPASFVVNYYSYPYPYTYSYMAAGWPNFYPMRTNAKMFFTQNSVDYVCSATVVTDGAAGVNRLVATAGHCVADGASHWDTSAWICPAYNNAIGPWGCWAASTFGTLTAWFSSGDFRYDHGFVVTATTSSTGYGRIGTVIGTNGIGWNQGYVQDIWSFGYPAAAPYDGNYLVWTTSSTAVIDDVYGTGAPYAIGIGSNETGGSSGGAWSIGQRLAIPGYVVSHNDYKYTSPAMPLAMFGPWQGTDWYNLWNADRVLNP